MFDYYRERLAPIPVQGIYWPSKPGAAQGLVHAGIDTASYYTMKSRSGDVGALGLAPWLQRLREQNSKLRIHLAGHSFGARLVTAAASVLPPGIVQSMTLIQAAFSQFAFQREGKFHGVVEPRRVAAPIVVTHSVHDHAVGFAYPVASRLARQNASTLGGREDSYGGLGRNGAAGAHAVAPGEIQNWTNEPILNVDCSRIIRSHSDVLHPELAAMIRSRCTAG
jgi:pimeloyl-ACP methyl ester carboxylesterase